MSYNNQDFEADIGFREIAVLIRKRFLACGIVAIAAGCATFFYHEQLTKFYGFTVLMEVPKFDFETNTDIALGSLARKINPAFDPTATPDREIEAFLNFKFVDSYRDPTSMAPYIKKIELQKSPRYIEIVVYAVNEQDGKTFIDNILAEVQKNYQPIIEDKRKAAENSIKILSSSVAALENGLLKASAASKQIGYSAPLAQQENEMKLKIATLQATLLSFQAQTFESNLRNARIVSFRPTKPSPSFPKTKLLTLVGTVLGFLGTLFVFLFLEMSVAAPLPRIDRNERTDPLGYRPPFPSKLPKKIA